MKEPVSATTRSRFILVSAVVGLSLLGDALLYALLPAKPGEFGVLIWQVGVLLGANRFVRLVTNEIAGRLIQNKDGNGPLLWALMVGGIVTASYALPIGFWGLLCARIIWGACWSVLRVEGYLSALSYSSNANRGRIFAVYQAATRLGQGGGLLIGGFLSELIGIPWTFLTFGICSGCGVIMVFKTPPRRREQPTEHGIESTLSMELAPLSGKRLSGIANDLIHNWPVRLWACGLFLTMAEQMIATLTGRFAAQRIGPQIPLALGIASLSGLLLSFRSFCSLLIGPIAGILSDRIGRRKLLGVLVALQSLCVAGLEFFEPWQLLILCFLIQFLSGTSARLLIYTIAGDLAPGEGGALHMNRFATFVDLGTALGPVVGFTLFAAHGFISVAAVVWLLLAAVFTLILFRFKHK
jgi:MFS family permease